MHRFESLIIWNVQKLKKEGMKPNTGYSFPK